MSDRVFFFAGTGLAIDGAGGALGPRVGIASRAPLLAALQAFSPPLRPGLRALRAFARSLRPPLRVFLRSRCLQLRARSRFF